MSFTHLHVHSQYSLLDGAIRLDDLVSKAKELGMNSVAVTDHGAMYGIVEFYKRAKKEGIKPIIGCEVYTAARTRFDKTHEYDSKSGHLVLLAETNEGYQNLIYIVSMASVEGYYYKPRVDFELLKGHSKGIIALSACLAGDIPNAIMNNDLEGAREITEKYIDIFGKNNFFIELQDHGIAEQKKVNAELIKIAEEYGLGLVATNDAHYVNKSDAYYQDVLMCIQMQKTVNDEDRMKFETDEFYLKSEDEMRSLFPQYPEAIENTQIIADRCNVELTFGQHHLPKYDLPDGTDAFEYLKMQCIDGLKSKVGDSIGEYMDRMEYELNTIKEMGFVDYFLIVWDYVKFAKENAIMVGPGRGSAAGSIVAYSLDITTINPLKYNLIFERFLNPERVTMPDIDMDFCYERRQEVIDYVTQKYGEDRVSQIITFGTLAARAAIRDVGRALDISYGECDAVAKQIPNELKMTIKKAVDVNPVLQEMMEADKKVEHLIEVSQALEGMPRHHSTHAAGVVISSTPVYEQVPVLKTEDGIVTEYTMTLLEELGLLKMDFLGLRTLTVIRDAVNMIEKDCGIKLDIDNIDLTDKATYDMISAGETMGVFQIESGGMKSFMRELKPNSLEDIIAGIALYRPGPMDSIPRYIDNKNHPDKITYAHPILENILDVTYGCIVYQEQVMQIVRDMAGYSFGRSDLVRRAMSKKKADVMEQERKNFIYGIVDEDGTVSVEGALRRGVSEKIANDIYDEMMSFAEYAFNKSHAAAYAVVSYQTAYLKCHYPAQFFAALLSSTDKFAKYFDEIKRLGIKLMPPDVNQSGKRFTVADGNIRFGIEAIKSIGANVAEAIINEREKNGPFVSYKDFCRRMSGQLSKRAHEVMIKAGVFDSLGVNRASLMTCYDSIIDSIADNKKRNLEGQISLFGMGDDISAEAEDYPDKEEFAKKEILAMEKEILEFYVSGHPLEEYGEKIKQMTDINIGDIMELISDSEDELEVRMQDTTVKDGDNVTVCGVISNVSIKLSKNGNRFAIVTLEDLYGSVEVMVFAKVLTAYGMLLNDGAAIVVKGRLSVEEDKGRATIISDEFVSLDTVSVIRKVYIQVNESNMSKMDEIKEILSNNRGDNPVYVYFSDRKQMSVAARNLWVDTDTTVIDELSRLLGEENVKIK